MPKIKGYLFSSIRTTDSNNSEVKMHCYNAQFLKLSIVFLLPSKVPEITPMKRNDYHFKLSQEWHYSERNFKALTQRILETYNVKTNSDAKTIYIQHLFPGRNPPEWFPFGCRESLWDTNYQTEVDDIEEVEDI